MPVGENYALYTERRGGIPARDPNAEIRERERERDDYFRDLAPFARRDHVLRYLMACGHTSLPNRAVCEQGCLKAPQYGAAFRGKTNELGYPTRGLS